MEKMEGQTEFELWKIHFLECCSWIPQILTVLMMDFSNSS